MLFPVTTIYALGNEQASTLMGSVIHFIQSGSWPVAIIIFVASVAVPLLKIIGLGYLLQRTEWRWLGHIAYLGVGIGVSFVIREFFISTATPSWWYMIILVIDALAVLALFWFLWRNPADKKAVAS